MKNLKTFSILAIFLLSLASVSAFGTQGKVAVKQNYQELSEVYVRDLNIKESSTRINLLTRESNGRVSLKGNIRVRGKLEDGTSFSLELKNLKAKNSFSSNKVSRFYTVKGEIIEEKIVEPISLDVNNEVKDGNFNVLAEGTLIKYPRDNGRAVKQLFEVTYIDGVLSVYDLKGLLVQIE